MTGLSVLAEREAGAGGRELRMFSPAVGREVSATLLTPPGWTPGDHGSHPVLYFLHGSSDEHPTLVARTPIAELAARTNALVVLPEGGRMGFYTDWRVPDRSGTIPAWERFHVTELLGLLSNRYGASETRMVAGISMGGYGALRYAMRHPSLFRAAASLSGFLHLTRPGMAALLGLLSVREGMRPGRVWGPRRRCFENWAANDPYVNAARLTGTRVYLAAGDGTRVPGEEFVAGMGLVERYSRAMTEDLATRLTELGGDVTTNLSTGTHFWTTWHRTVGEMWPFVREVLGT
jgi:diacylglycerol O-acyltransferase/trehalose O-mycolyltransferase